MANEQNPAIVSPNLPNVPFPGVAGSASEVRRMAAVRAVLIAIMILAMAVTPLLVPSFGGGSDSSTAYASFAGGTRTGDRSVAPQQNGNNNDNDDDDDDNDDGDNDDDDNDDGDNDDDDNNDNDSDDNDNGDDGDDNDNDSDGNDNVRIVVQSPRDSVNRPTKCFDTREVSTIQLGTGSYDVTVQVMPHSSFGQTTRMTLRALDPSSVPGPGSAGTLVDSVVFQLDAQAGCDGAAIGTLPNAVNLGIVYNVTSSVDKAKLQIVKLDGSSWTNVATVPDPTAGNPYVSATISSAGTYALIQKP
ncbi:MAG: hypothetical protein IT306_20995 [Chloroflexi bacterium]|nr:hypothetical protein [Chloroflexota bacterium]